MTLEERLGRWTARGLLCLLAAVLAQAPADPPTLLAGKLVQGKSVQGQTLQGPAVQGQALQGPAVQGPKVGQPQAAPLVKAPAALPPSSVLPKKSGEPSPLGKKSLSGVKSQQGRVSTDPDWNEDKAKPPASALPALNPKALAPPEGAEALEPKLPPKAFLPSKAQPPEPGRHGLDREEGGVRFGDARHGRRPPSGESASASEYRLGGGEEGNVGPADLSRLTDPKAIEGGVPPEAAGEAERRAPESLAGGGESQETGKKGKSLVRPMVNKAKGSAKDGSIEEALKEPDLKADPGASRISVPEEDEEDD